MRGLAGTLRLNTSTSMTFVIPVLTIGEKKAMTISKSWPHQVTRPYRFSNATTWSMKKS
jgi:hypothetical protein